MFGEGINFWVYGFFTFPSFHTLVHVAYKLCNPCYNAFQCVSLFHFFEQKIYKIYAVILMSNIPQSTKAEPRMVIKRKKRYHDVRIKQAKAIMTNKMRVDIKSTNTLVCCKV